MYFRASVFWELYFLEGVFQGDVRDPESKGYKSLFIESILIVIRCNLQIGFPQNPIFLMNLNFKRKGQKVVPLGNPTKQRRRAGHMLKQN